MKINKHVFSKTLLALSLVASVSFITPAFAQQSASIEQILNSRPSVWGYSTKHHGIDLNIISTDVYVLASKVCPLLLPSLEMYFTGVYVPSTLYIGPYTERYSFKCAFRDNRGGEYLSPTGRYRYWTMILQEHSSFSDLASNYSEQCTPTVGNPITPAWGEKQQVEDDFVELTNSPIHFKRYYNSGAVYNQYIGSFGLNWSHTYDRRIITGSVSQANHPSIISRNAMISEGPMVTLTSNDPAKQLPINEIDYAYVVRANGKALYHQKTDNVWLTDYGVNAQLSVLPNNDGWLFITKNNIRETYDVYGRLILIENTKGDSQNLFYDISIDQGGDGNPSTLDLVEDNNLNKLIFTYNNDSRLSQLTTSEGDVYSYSYNSLGVLSGVTYPNTTTRIYHYDSSLSRSLTGITDENDIRYVSWQYDNLGRAISSENLNGVNRTTLDYTDLSPDGNGSVLVTNSLGKETTFYYQVQNGVRKLIQVEGHPSANCAGANKNYTYDINGFMASKTDWKGNTTTYINNDRGQVLSRTEASGTPQARTITTEWHADYNLPTKITEPSRIITMTYDSNGRLLSRNVTER